jgi:transposase InsO family protein
MPSSRPSITAATTRTGFDPSDRGTHDLSIRYAERLADAGVEPSVGSRGNSYDTALAESVMVSETLRHSCRRAFIGSIRDARLAGT